MSRNDEREEQPGELDVGITGLATLANAAFRVTLAEFLKLFRRR